MRKLEELINIDESAWPDILEWIVGAANMTEILPLMLLRRRRCC